MVFETSRRSAAYCRGFHNQNRVVGYILVYRHGDYNRVVLLVIQTSRILCCGEGVTPGAINMKPVTVNHLDAETPVPEALRTPIS